MTYRVIQWASGAVGRAAMQGLLAHPDLDLVGCGVHSSEKDGVDIGTLLSRRPIGVSAPTDVAAVLSVEADRVLYSPIFADVEVITRILESGKNVVTPLGRFYPPEGERDRIDAVCRVAGVTLHGTGIDASTNHPPTTSTPPPSPRRAGPSCRESMPGPAG